MFTYHRHCSIHFLEKFLKEGKSIDVLCLSRSGMRYEMGSGARKGQAR